MAKYDPAYRHDRAGRLVDAQAFEPLEFDTSCFAPKLLAEFKQDARSTVRIENEGLTRKRIGLKLNQLIALRTMVQQLFRKQ
jgi:isocitrate dehydrogenase kinase/phosphatase